MGSLIDRRSVLMYAPEPSAKTIQRGTPWDVVPTGAGVTQTALVSAQLTGATADSYVGWFVEVTDPASNVAGECVRITAFNPATDTATLEGFSAAPSSSTTAVRLWKPPMPFVTPTAVGSTTTVVDTKHTEATDYWANPDAYWMVGVVGANAGKWAQITDWNSGSSTWTVATGPGSAAWAASVVGDLNEIWRGVMPVAGELPRGETPTTYIERRFVEGTFTQQPGVVTSREGGTFAVSLEVRGASAVASGATLATRPIEAGGILQSILGENADGTGTVAGGSTTTSIVLGGGEGARFTVGNVVMINGEAAGITAIATDTLTISPALSAAPASGVICYGGCNYRPIDTGYRTLSWLAWVGGTLRQMMCGHLPSLKIEGLLQNEIPRLVFEGPLDGHISYPTTSGPGWTVQHDATMPIPARVSRVMLGGTNVVAPTATFDVGLEVQPRPAVTGFAHRDGNEVVGRKSMGTLRVWASEGSAAMDELRRFQRGAVLDLLIQCGSTPTKTFVLWLPKIQYSGAPLALEGGQYLYDLAWVVPDARPLGATVKDFCLGFI